MNDPALPSVRQIPNEEALLAGATICMALVKRGDVTITEPIGSTFFAEIIETRPLYRAAPDLLASLDELVNSPNAKQNACWDRARAALAKARA